jgi:hypothetical protein
MGKRIRMLKAVLAWIHLIEINVGWYCYDTMIFAGLTGSRILDVITSGGASAVSKLMSNNPIKAQFILPM